MLFSKVLVSMSVVGMMSISAMAQSETKFQKVSHQLVAQANAALGTDQFADAQLLYERALVASPSNTAALIGLGRSHEGQGRVGKGLKYYRQALEIEPNDQRALEVQALAFLKRDMKDRADSNRDKLARLCANGCAALASVETAIEAYQVDKDEKTATIAENKDG